MMKGFYGTIYEQNSVVLTDDCSVILSEMKNPDSTYTRFFAEAQNDNEGRFFADAQTDNLCQNNISFIQKIRKNLQKSIVQAYGENKQA